MFSQQLLCLAGKDLRTVVVKVIVTFRGAKRAMLGCGNLTQALQSWQAEEKDEMFLLSQGKTQARGGTRGLICHTKMPESLLDSCLYLRAFVLDHHLNLWLNIWLFRIHLNIAKYSPLIIKRILAFGFQSHHH